MYAIEPNVDAIRPKYLKTRNYYQRLGFNDIGPTPHQIERACHARRKMLKDSFDEFSKDDWTAARNLVEEAYDCLIQPHLRRRYDARLQRKFNGIPKARNLVLSRYQIGEKLSEGDRTTIYEAHDTHLSRDCIIKRINPRLHIDAEHQALLRYEAELFASHNSGHLVKILDFDASQGIIVLEKMGGNISSLAKPSGTDPHLVYELLEQALRGLDAMHSQGLAHGRIDHDHLLLDDRKQIKLSVTPGVSGIASASSPSATTKYVAPEMLNPGIFGNPGVAIDLYALGFVMLELLVGKGFAKKVNPGFSPKGNDSQNWLLWHASATDHLPPVHEFCPHIDPSFAEVLERMVSKDQNKRFKSADECLRALAQGEKPTAHLLIHKSGRQSDATQMHPIGTPDPLADTFQIERSISWQQIISEPQILLSPDGRQHAAILFVGLLLTCSFVLILFGSPEVTPENPVLASAETPEDRATAPDPPDICWQVTFDVKGGGKVSAVDSVKKTSDSEEWELPPGEHHASVIDSPGSPARSVPFTLAQGHGSITVSIGPPLAITSEPAEEPSNNDSGGDDDAHSDDVDGKNTSENAGHGHDYSPTEEETSAAMITHKVFHPPMQKLPIVGAVDTVRQDELRQVLKELCRYPARKHDEPLPFALPESPDDPRFSFANALICYQRGDKDKAQAYCRRSLDDTEHFGIVFMPTVLLSSQIHMMQGKCMMALADCRSALRTLLSNRTRMNDQETSNVTSELCWWTGTLVGIIENTDVEKSKFRANTPATSNEFQQMCSPENWQWFEAGRKRSADLAIELTLAWESHQSKRDDDSWKNQIKRSNRHEYRRDQQAAERKAEIEAARMWWRPHDNAFASDRYSSNGDELGMQTKAEDRILRPTPPFRGSSPDIFRSYVPDDISLLAQRAFDSVVAPRGNQSVASR